MGLVSPSQSSHEDEITEAVINTPINQLAAVINGGLDANNLADAAVTTAKLSDDSVTVAKISDTSFLSASYTPTVTAGSGAYGSVTATGRSLQFGKMLWLQMDVTLTNVGTGGGACNISLPSGLTGKVTQMIAGREDALTGKVLQGKISAGGTSVGVYFYDGAAPSTVGNGAALRLTGLIEVA